MSRCKHSLVNLTGQRTGNWPRLRCRWPRVQPTSTTTHQRSAGTKIQSALSLRRTTEKITAIHCQRRSEVDEQQPGKSNFESSRNDGTWGIYLKTLQFKELELHLSSSWCCCIISASFQSSVHTAQHSGNVDQSISVSCDWTNVSLKSFYFQCSWKSIWKYYKKKLYVLNRAVDAKVCMLKAGCDRVNTKLSVLSFVFLVFFKKPHELDKAEAEYQSHLVLFISKT